MNQEKQKHCQTPALFGQVVTCMLCVLYVADNKAVECWLMSFGVHPENESQPCRSLASSLPGV